MSAAQALATALYARLAAALDVPVHDAPPVGAALPYAVIGPIRSTAWGAGDFDGAEHVVSVQVWSRHAGAKEVRLLMDAAQAALDMPLDVTGHRVVLLAVLSAEDAREADGVTRRGLLRLRALTEPEG